MSPSAKSMSLPKKIIPKTAKTTAFLFLGMLTLEPQAEKILNISSRDTVP